MAADLAVQLAENQHAVQGYTQQLTDAKAKHLQEDRARELLETEFVVNQIPLFSFLLCPEAALLTDMTTFRNGLNAPLTNTLQGLRILDPCQR